MAVRFGRVLRGAALVAFLAACAWVPSAALAGEYKPGLYVAPVYSENREILAQHSRVLFYEEAKEHVLFLPSGWVQIPLTLPTQVPKPCMWKASLWSTAR